MSLMESNRSMAWAAGSDWGTPGPSIAWWRASNPHVTWRSYWDFNGFKESGFLHLDAEIQFEGGGRFGPELNMISEGLHDPFEISPGIVIPTGSCSSLLNSWDFGSDPSKSLSFLGRADFGQFFTGNRYGGNATLTYRRGETLSSSLLVDHNIIRLPEGDFEATQYSDEADIWSTNIRFAWLSTAGTGLYMVYNGAQRTTRLGEWGEPITRGFIIKYARQLRLF